MEQWIKTEAALPNDYEEVLIVVRVSPGTRYITMDMMYTNIHGRRDWMKHPSGTITHWMHKPDLPEV